MDHKIENTLTDDKEIKKLYNKKKQNYFYKNVKRGTEVAYYEEGWEFHQQLKTQTKLKKEKPLDLQFEEKTWCVFSKLGFDEINIDRNFKIPISDNSKVNSKQIDVFVKDNNVALIIECKSSIEMKKRSLRSEINEINGYREEIIKFLKNKYDRNLKIGFLLVTKNISFNSSDLELAKTHNITIIDEEKLDYYSTITEQIGTSAKYQLLAEVFEGIGINNLNCSVPAIRSKIGGQTFYCFMIEPSYLLPIAYVAHKLKTPDEVNSYQRIMQKNKLKEIRKYIQEEKGLFPNSIILNFRTKNEDSLKFDMMSGQKEFENTKFGILHLPAKYKSAWIIDGQHRLYGFADTEEAEKVPIPVIAFENLNASQQSNYFVDINSKQTNVSKNLLQELYSSLLWESDKEDEKLVALISKISNDLGAEYDSPLYNKIKNSNVSKGIETPITLSTLTDSLRKYNLIAEVIKKKNSFLIPRALSSPEEPYMDKTLKRSKEILKGYFNFFKEENSHNWNLSPKKGGYLCSNNGLVALLFVLSEVLKHERNNSPCELFYVNEDELLNEYIYPKIKPVIDYFNEASYETIKFFKAQQGAYGQKKCGFEMMRQINKKFPEFNPFGLQKHIEDNDEEKTKEVKLIIHDLEKKIHDDVIQSLKEEFDNSWWSYIPKEARKDINDIKEENNESNVEKCFYLVHYEKIIFANWQLFENTYSIGKKGETGKKKNLAWFKRLIDLRNKTSHPQRGNVTKKEYDFVMDINEILVKRLEEK